MRRGTRVHCWAWLVTTMVIDSWVNMSWIASKPRKPQKFYPRNIPAIGYGTHGWSSQDGTVPRKLIIIITLTSSDFMIIFVIDFEIMFDFEIDFIIDLLFDLMIVLLRDRFPDRLRD